MLLSHLFTPVVMDLERDKLRVVLKALGTTMAALPVLALPRVDGWSASPQFVDEHAFWSGGHIEK